MHGTGWSFGGSDPAFRGPRERLLHLGPRALSDEELVAIVLGTGRSGEPATALASRLLGEAGGLQGLQRLGVGGLSRLSGVGPAKAARLVAAIELGCRALSRPLRRDEPICSAAEVVAAMRPRLALEQREHFLAIALDARNRPIAELELAVGGWGSVEVDPRAVFRALLQVGALGAIFVHNHPSGDPRPSPLDAQLTQRLLRGGELLGIRVLDHVVVARDGYFSFGEVGMLPGT